MELVEQFGRLLGTLKPVEVRVLFHRTCLDEDTTQIAIALRMSRETVRDVLDRLETKLLAAISKSALATARRALRDDSWRMAVALSELLPAICHQYRDSANEGNETSEELEKIQFLFDRSAEVFLAMEAADTSLEFFEQMGLSAENAALLVEIARIPDEAKVLLWRKLILIGVRERVDTTDPEVRRHPQFTNLPSVECFAALVNLYADAGARATREVDPGMQELFAGVVQNSPSSAESPARLDFKLSEPRFQEQIRRALLQPRVTPGEIRPYLRR